MAKKTVVETFDDITGERIDTDIVPNPTITFGIDGVDYEIELGAKNQGKLYAFLEPYTKAARKVGGRRLGRSAAPSGNGSSRLSRAELDNIRAWAQRTGHDVSTRGRLPKDLIDAYRAANN
jgi:hypothetical protein